MVPLFTFSSLIRSFTFSLGITIRNQIVCTSLEFNEFFGSSFDVPCFVFSSFVVQFSRYRFVAALCDSLYSISHSVPFVKGFSKLFSSFFSTFSFASSRIFCFFSALSLSLLAFRAPAPLRSFIILPLSSPFVNPFFHLFSTFSGFLFDVSGVLSFFSRLWGLGWVFLRFLRLFGRWGFLMESFCWKVFAAVY